jgi:hypothetical protein
MSIALSVSLLPSRYVRICVVLLVLVLWLQGIWFLTRTDLSIRSAGLPGLACLLAGVWIGYAGRKVLRACHLTISPDGQIMLASEGAKVATVRLHASSVLWPQALFLRLQDIHGHTRSVLVLPIVWRRTSYEPCSLVVAGQW